MTIWVAKTTESIIQMEFLCTGTRISIQHVLTSSHCGFYKKKPGELDFDAVYIGARSSALDVNVDMYYVVSARVSVKTTDLDEESAKHPFFEYHYSTANSIAVLTIQRSSQLLTARETVPWQVGGKPRIDFLRKSRTKCYSVGWGTKTQLSKRLKQTNLYLLPMKRCLRIIKASTGKDKYVCARLAEAPLRTKDACYGDEGAPLICAGEVIGISLQKPECPPYIEFEMSYIEIAAQPFAMTIWVAETTASVIKMEFLCTGTRISIQHVITSSHCGFFDRKPGELDFDAVYIGARSSYLDVNVDMYYVVSARITVNTAELDPDTSNHPLFQYYYSTPNSIAVLTIQRSDQPLVAREAIPWHVGGKAQISTIINGGTTCFTVGWGTKSLLNRRLKQTNLRIVPMDFCVTLIRYLTGEHLRPLNENKFVCARSFGVRNLIKNKTCYGDEGAPLICGGELIGVSLQGPECSPYQKLYLFTTLYYSRSFLQSLVLSIHENITDPGGIILPEVEETSCSASTFSIDKLIPFFSPLLMYIIFIV